MYETRFLPHLIPTKWRGLRGMAKATRKATPRFDSPAFSAGRRRVDVADQGRDEVAAHPEDQERERRRDQRDSNVPREREELSATWTPGLTPTT